MTRQEMGLATLATLQSWICFVRPSYARTEPLRLKVRMLTSLPNECKVRTWLGASLDPFQLIIRTVSEPPIAIRPFGANARERNFSPVFAGMESRRLYELATLHS